MIHCHFVLILWWKKVACGNKNKMWRAKCYYG
jgi:hypothetical protein